jgi:hypothetical protein
MNTTVRTPPLTDVLLSASPMLRNVGMPLVPTAPEAPVYFASTIAAHGSVSATAVTHEVRAELTALPESKTLCDAGAAPTLVGEMPITAPSVNTAPK